MSLIKNKIRKLQIQVERAEAKGNFNSAHHRVLASYIKPVEGVTPRNTRRGDKEKPDDGE